MRSLNGQFRVLIFKYFKINQSFLTFFGKIPLEASQALNTCQKCGKMKNDKCPPFRLMCIVPIERIFETGKISVMKGSTRVLVKIVLFQLKGCGHPQDDTMPNFIPDSKCPL